MEVKGASEEVASVEVKGASEEVASVEVKGASVEAGSFEEVSVEVAIAARLCRAEAYTGLKQYRLAMEDTEFCLTARRSAEVGLSGMTQSMAAALSLTPGWWNSVPV